MDTSEPKVRRRIDEWKLKLIDLSRRSRLLYFTPARSSSILIKAPDIKTVFDRLVVKGRSWEIWQPPKTEPQR